jgi:hypothetical protein
MKTIKEIRKQFWVEFPEFSGEYKANKRQNNYSCNCRCAFVAWVDYLQKDGVIPEKLANKVTL